ncbi:MAG: flavodoxin family protein [Clostridia bacterium]|nr:flavodoxin family protein [Clostridia bacterium]
MSKVMLINGSPNQFGCTYTGLTEIAAALERQGIQTEILHIGSGPMAGCNGCNACRQTKRCCHQDKVNYILEQLDDIDGIVVGSPVYYAAASGQIASFMDRLFWAGGSRLAGKVGAAMVSCRRAGSSAALDQLHKYFSIAAMPIATSQYWNMIHGNTPDEARQDLEGMQVMRFLGENMAWLIRSIKAGREAGVPAPAREKRVRTNFIR